MPLTVHPLTPDRWDDLVELFGRPGGSIVRGCWCMCYRQSGAPAHTSTLTPAARNKRALKRVVDGGTVPGLVGYERGRLIAWISLGPRVEYRRLQRSPVMKPVDDQPVWSVVCFFVDQEARGRGIAEAMLKGALKYARTQGATLLEAYPVDTTVRRNPDDLWFGTASMFDACGFTEVARRKPNRPVMRKRLAR